MQIISSSPVKQPIYLAHSIVTSLILLAPATSHAQGFPDSELSNKAGAEAAGFVATFMEVLLTPVIILLIAIALLVFIYGATTYVLNSENEQARADGKRNMIFGIIGLFVMISAYSIFWIFVNTFGLDEQFEQIDTVEGG